MYTIGQGGPQGNIGGFDDTYYWSSSEYGTYDAWGVDFSNGGTLSSPSFKDGAGRVRVIRAF